MLCKQFKHPITNNGNNGQTIHGTRAHTSGELLGCMGQGRVNVLSLNLTINHCFRKNNSELGSTMKML